MYFFTLIEKEKVLVAIKYLFLVESIDRCKDEINFVPHWVYLYWTDRQAVLQDNRIIEVEKQ